MHIHLPRRPLNLQPLPDQIKRKHPRLRGDRGEGPACGINPAGGDIKVRCDGEEFSGGLVGAEEETHVGHNLCDTGAEAAEEAPGTFVLVDVFNRKVEGLVNLGVGGCELVT